MGQTISLAEVRATQARAAEYLDSATVVAVAPSHVEVELIGGARVDAQLALAMPYQPAMDDELLVIGRPGRYWVIGVVSGRGSLELRMPGDVDIHAMNGTLRLSGDEGVEVHGSTVRLVSKDLRLVADKVVKRFNTVVTRVRDMWSVRAGQRQTIVEGDSIETAERVTILGKENVAINGEQIHLG
jgi:hypothetical protein